MRSSDAEHAGNERPPRLARALVRLLLPGVTGEVIGGDLDEEYAERVIPLRGRARARRWYWGQAVRSIAAAWRPAHRSKSRSRKVTVIDTLRQDIGLAVRALVRRPAFTLLAVSTLALGIGAHAALFSVVDGVLLKSLDLPRADGLVMIRVRVRGELRLLSGADVSDLEERTGAVFSGMGGFVSTSGVIENPDGTRETRAAVGATPGIFETLGVPLQIGGPWGPEAEGTGAVGVVVISDRLWRGRFGADTALVGGTILLNGTPVRVAGVMPRGFEFPTRETADFIHPLVSTPSADSRRDIEAFGAIARLRHGVSIERARAEVERVWAGLREEHPGALRDHGIAVIGLKSYLIRDVRSGLLALLGATGLFLLLACANVASLLLARGMGRGSEMAVRAALAGLAGLLLAEGGLRVLSAVAPAGIPRIDAVDLDGRALAFAVLVSLGCSLLVGLPPALRTSGANLAGALRSGMGRATQGKRLRRLQAVLVVSQVATAVVLALAAGLLLRSFSTLTHVDPGYRTRGVLTASVAVPEDLYPDRSARAGFFERAEREVEELPGVLEVGSTLRPPFSSGQLLFPVRLADGDAASADEATRAELGIVSGGYLEALGIPVIRGRNFNADDRAGGPRVALVSAELARTLFGDADPIGRRLAPVITTWEDATNWAEIVGVVGDIRLEGLDAEARGTLYLATLQQPQPFGTVVVHAEGGQAGLARSIREGLLRVEPRMPVPSVQTLASMRAESLARPRFHTLLLGVFAALAVTLAAVGIYGVLSYSVAARKMELGVRIAFGADRGRVVRLILGEGMTLAGIGLAAGLAGGLVAGRALRSLLFGIVPADPLTYAAITLFVAGIAVAGCMVPALRASAADPVQVLRRE